MNREELLRLWRAEEEASEEYGWDFSYLSGRMTESPLPWDYGDLIRGYLVPSMELLDIDTGGGEFLLSLNHPAGKTCATEGYPPNLELCRRMLCPVGIDLRPWEGREKLPFEDGRFDMVIDRHGNFNAQEIFRVLKEGGLFITQQVGALNDRELVTALMGDLPLPYPEQSLALAEKAFREAGFSILQGEEHFGRLAFTDVGALVWFAVKIPWEFPDFSVDGCFENLLRVQKTVEEQGFVEGKTHRFLLVAQKPHRTLVAHYDGLLAAGNDPVADPPQLRAYMDRWDGQIFLEKMNLTPSDSVLEIGVGTGRLALRTAPRCGSFTGIDLTPETARRAAEYLSPYAHAKVLCGDFLTCPIEERFDVIYSSLTLFHIPHKESAMRKIASLMKPGGRLVLSLDRECDPVLDAGFGRLDLFPDRVEEFLSLLDRYGFSCAEQTQLPYATVLSAVFNGG